MMACVCLDRIRVMKHFRVSRYSVFDEVCLVGIVQFTRTSARARVCVCVCVRARVCACVCARVRVGGAYPFICCFVRRDCQ